MITHGSATTGRYLMIGSCCRKGIGQVFSCHFFARHNIELGSEILKTAVSGHDIAFGPITAFAVRGYEAIGLILTAQKNLPSG